MRHSDINLTMGLYTHTLITDRARAVNELPSLSDCIEDKKTGTFDAAGFEVGKGAYLQGDLQGHNFQKMVKIGNYCRTENGLDQAIKNAAKTCINRHYGVDECWLPPRDSNPDLLIQRGLSMVCAEAHVLLYF
ncbi:MAG: hypothetical protein JXR97_12355 [Planctomycetes bacterium]|nr:hypothetical protein [Planctomycetota bacterium]